MNCREMKQKTFWSNFFKSFDICKAYESVDIVYCIRLTIDEEGSKVNIVEVRKRQWVEVSNYI